MADLKELTVDTTSMTIPVVGDIYVGSKNVRPTSTTAYAKGGSVNLPKGKYVATAVANVNGSSSTARRTITVEVRRTSDTFFFGGLTLETHNLFASAIVPLIFELTADATVEVSYKTTGLPTSDNSVWIRAIRVGG